MCNDPWYMLVVKDWQFWKRKIILPFSVKKRYKVEETVDSFTPKFREHLRAGRKDFGIRVTLRVVLSAEQMDFYRPFFNQYSRISAFQIFKIPCRKCLGCQLDRKNQWASRCLIEAREHKNNLFCTFTYDEKHVPLELNRKHWQDFMKRLRSAKQYAGEPSPRQYYRGEYGETTFRPHFHAILFNCEFLDKIILYWKTKRGKRVYHACPGAVPYYTSPTLANLWSHGYVVVAPVCEQTMKYVANYLDKGVAPNASVKPFNGMSTRPAIGRAYFDRHLNKDDFVGVVREFKLPSPFIKYYNRLLKELLLPHEYLEIEKQRNRVLGGRPQPWEQTSLTEHEYLKQREERLRRAFERRRKKKVDVSFNHFLTRTCKFVGATSACGER